jgi:hypothetical protein
MDGSGLNDFFSQIPIGMVLMPIAFGAVYIVMMAVIFRRAAERRRKARAVKIDQGYVPPQSPALMQTVANRLSKLSSVRASLGSGGQGAIAADLPEPDIDLLTLPPAEITRFQPKPSVPYPPQIVDAEIVSETPSPRVGASWKNAVAPVQETNMMSAGFESASASASEMADVVEVMRIYRDMNDGSLIVQMGGQRYRTLNQVQSPDLARRFTAVVRELWSMVSGASVGSVVTPLPPPEQVGLPPRTSGGEDLKPNRLGRLTQNVMGSKAAKTDQPTGIADAIEEFLQYRLIATPEFAARSIHIRPSSDHGVSIEVDGHYYQSVGDVIDPDVREFLGNVMREWEARH